MEVKFLLINGNFPGANPDTSTAQFPTNIIYENPGEYVVALEIENACGVI